MNIYLEIFLRTLFSIAVIFILARLNGAKQVSQLTFYDYIVGITAGSIAASMCIETDIPLWGCLLAVVLFMFSAMLMSFLANKSIVLRRLFTGSPVVLVDKGEICYRGLKHARFDVNDLLRELRAQGYFDLNQVQFAILETNGQLSVMLKSADRPPTASELNVVLPEGGLYASVIIDGKILAGNLKAFKRDEPWLRQKLDEQQAGELDTIAVGLLTEQGDLSLYYKKMDDKGTRTVFQ